MDDFSDINLTGYELREYLGTGGFGVVYRAFESAFGRDVAVKIILPQFASQPDFIQRFEKEMHRVARLEHPHIIPLYHYWRNSEQACVVTRLLRGGNLRQVLQKGVFTIERAALLLDQMAAALQVAHRSDIIHGNLKPENILFDEDGNPYLADFGIAVLNKPAATKGASIKTAVATLNYLAPEQLRVEPVTPQSDIYALAVVLYETLAGASPFTAAKVEQSPHHLNDLMPLITNLAPEIAEAVSAVLQKATANNPDSRYPDPTAFAAAFREAARLSYPQTKNSIAESLTMREHEVLQRLIEGKSNQEIAGELYLAVTTVKWYNKQIFHKLHVRNRVQAVIRARELLLIDPTPLPAGAVTAGAPEPVNPYKGLRAFQSADTQDFFGREKLVRELLDRLAETPPRLPELAAMPLREPSYARFLAVVGPSGSGKSSLIKAGLIPALWRGDLLKPEHWLIVEVVPGSHPIENVAAELAKFATQTTDLRELLAHDSSGLIQAAQLILPDDGSELVLVIDQFEEVFTLVRHETIRAQFLNLIVKAVTDLRSRLRVVITLRADFYDRPLHYVEFGEMMRSRMVTILPLTAGELENAITCPAERAGVTFEPGLAVSMIAEVSDQPGALPLLQFTLTELFERRKGLLLTCEAYEAVGRVVGALAKQADQIYAELSDAEKEVAQQMFLRLVTLGEGTEHTRRRVLRSELEAITGDKDLMEDVVETYTTYRMLSLDYDPTTRAPRVEIAHEALIQGWGQLREWLNASQEDLRIQRQLMAAAEEWSSANHDPTFLASGGRLARFESIAETSRLALSQNERDFLSASIAERSRRENVREAQQKRRLRLQHTIIAALGVFLLTFIFLSVTSLISRNDAIAQTNIAFSRQLAAQAVAELRNPVGNDEYAALLAIRALRDNYDSVGDGALVEAAFRLPRMSLVGHTDVVYDAAFSPDGRYILTGSGDATARLWDAVTGQLVWAFSDEGGEVYAVAFSPDGNYVVTGDEHHLATLWNATTGEIVRPFVGHEGEVDRVAFSPDGKFLLTQSVDDMTVRLWDLDTGQQRYVINGDAVRGIAFSPDGSSFLMSDLEFSATRRDTSTGNVIQTYKGHNSSVNSLAFSPDGKYVLTGSLDNTAILWEAETGLEVFTLKGHSGSVRGVAFSPDGRYLLTGSSDRTMRLWNAATGEELRRFSAHLGRVWSIAFSPDGRTIVSASADGTAKLWTTVINADLATFGAQPDEIYDVAFSPAGSTVLTGSADGTARLWYVATGQIIHAFAGHTRVVYGAVFSPDGAYALTASGDGSAKLWDAATGREIRTFNAHDDQVFGVAFSPDGTYMLTGSADETAKLWDVATGDEIRTLRGHIGEVLGVAFSPDGAYVLTASGDGSAKLWDAASGQEVRTFVPRDAIVNDADFSPDGKYILMGTGIGDVILWDIATGQEVRSYVGATNSVYNVAFSTDGNYVAAATADRTAIVWDMATGAIVRILRGHRNAVWGIAFSPDGRSVLTGSLDHTLNLWQLDYRSFVESVCQRLSRDFIDQERELVPIHDHDPTCPSFVQDTASSSPSASPNQ